MKISYKCDYALKIILDLAEHSQIRLVHRREIAKRQDIPERFLEQILRLLMKGGFVHSKKGPNGGYSLTRAPKEISLGDIVRFIEGPIFPIACVDPAAPSPCDFVPKCPFYGIWKDVGDAVAHIVDNTDFEQIQQQASALKGRENLIYYI
ncbi:MAG: Rrf2 family transcriptional regulator [bacterium]|nr:Rrf2 family transcriptional regulator [bacterium]